MPIVSGRRRLRRAALALTGFGIGVLLAAGCSVADMRTDPNELLKQTVSGLSGTDNFQFEGTTRVSVGELPMMEGAAFRGAVADHNRLTMQFSRPPDAGVVGTMGQGGDTRPVVFNRKQDEWIVTESESDGEANLLLPWSPLLKLEQLNTMAKRVEGARDESDSRLTVLTVTPEPADVTKEVQSQLARQAGMLDTDKRLGELQAKLGLTGQDTVRLKAEVDQSVKRTKQLLDEARTTMQASSVFRIWVDRVSRLPQKMQVETVLEYKADGKPKREKTQVDYRFFGYDGRANGT